MTIALGPVVCTSTVLANGSDDFARRFMPGFAAVGRLLLVAAPGLASGCADGPRDDIEFTAGSSGGAESGEGSSSAGSSATVTTTTTATSDATESTGAAGCQVDQDCVGDPAGPHCDLETNTCGGDCFVGDTRGCYSGPIGTDGLGACKQGVETCLEQGIWSAFCDGEVVPSSDDCNANDVDDDCDGLVDDTDLDGDGFGACSSDCCDVDGGGCEGASLVNPGAFEVDDNGVDDDCDGELDEPTPTCDAGLTSSSSDGDDYARAMELCQFTDEDPRDPVARVWGVIDAHFSRTNGKDLPLPVQRSLRGDFGDIIDPEAGQRMAALSTGHAADATDTDPAYAPFQNGVNLATQSEAPADWLNVNEGSFPNPAGCQEPGDTLAHDPIMLTLRVRVPTNARSFSLMMQFFSAEYPEWVCSEYNDFFLALVESSAENPEDKNIAIYDDGDTVWPVGVNLVNVAEGLFTQCENGEIGCSGPSPTVYEGCLGTALLEGTGFDAPDNTCEASQDIAGGGTGWLRMSGNATPGEIMELRFAIWDTTGHLFDSLVLLDAFEWSLDGASPGVAPPG